MENIRKLLDAVVVAKGLSSKSDLAKELDVNKARISAYYSGKECPNEFACLQIAKALNRDYNEISAIVRMEAEKDEKRRAAWAQYYKSIGGYAASLLLGFFLVVTLIVTPTPAKAAPVLEKGTQHFVLCKRLVKKIRAAIVAAARMLSTAIPRFGFSG